MRASGILFESRLKEWGHRSAFDSKKAVSRLYEDDPLHAAGNI